jgi:Tat protein secretion system quality control protein TatD with DNase activity
VAWEPISEIDLVTGATPHTAAAFAEQAALAIRHADPRRRPVTVSHSGIVDWPEVNKSKAVDIIQTHPYGEHPKYLGNLSEMIVDSVRERLRKYGKPVLVGECGLDARPPVKTITLA